MTEISDNFEAIGWKQVSKSSTESADKPDSVRHTVVYQAIQAHACPICGYAHAPNIQASADIASDAADEHVKARLGSLKTDAVKAMLQINANIGTMARLLEKEKKDDRGTKTATESKPDGGN